MLFKNSTYLTDIFLLIGRCVVWSDVETLNVFLHIGVECRLPERVACKHRMILGDRVRKLDDPWTKFLHWWRARKHVLISWHHSKRQAKDIVLGKNVSRASVSQFTHEFGSVIKKLLLFLLNILFLLWKSLFFNLHVIY